MQTAERRISGIVIAVVVVVAAVVYYFTDPAEAGWLPQCLFHKLTGYDCPGCGSQRMVHALLRGDVVKAWESNTLLLISLPYLMFWLIVEESPRRCREHPRYSVVLERLHNKMNSRAAVTVIVILIIAWLIIRNLH